MIGYLAMHGRLLLLAEEHSAAAARGVCRCAIPEAYLEHVPALECSCLPWSNALMQAGNVALEL